jgi:hypothetical protein
LWSPTTMPRTSCSGAFLQCPWDVPKSEVKFHFSVATGRPYALMTRYSSFGAGRRLGLKMFHLWNTSLATSSTTSEPELIVFLPAPRMRNAYEEARLKTSEILDRETTAAHWAIKVDWFNTGSDARAKIWKPSSGTCTSLYLRLYLK